MDAEWFESTPRKNFTKKQREEVYKSSKGSCYICGQSIHIREWHIDHVDELADGGEHAPYNWKAVCVRCHIGKTSVNKTRRASEGRKRRAFMGIKETKSAPMFGSKRSPFKKKMNGEVVWRD